MRVMIEDEDEDDDNSSQSIAAHPAVARLCTLEARAVMTGECAGVAYHAS
jgi:hypothetical protein